ncbi:ABC transporter permease [candidate division KSB1 bacterium]
MRPPSGRRGLPRLPNLWIGAGLTLLLVLGALAAPWIAPADPFRVDLARILGPVSGGHPLGTDYLGRDTLSRIVFGARISVRIGLVAALISMVIGTLIGLVAAFSGGWLDSLLMRFTDVLMAFPSALLALAAMAVFDNPSVEVVFIVLGLIGWTTIARLVRSRVLSIKEEEYILAARVSGLGSFNILFRHVLPNAFSPILVATTLAVASNILTESFLSFIGLGAQPPLPSWGAMITEAQPYLTTRPWASIFPGLAIFISVMGFNLLGDGLRDLWDPKTSIRR